MIALREVQLIGMAPEGGNQTQYDINSRSKSDPRQVYLVVETNEDQFSYL